MNYENEFYQKHISRGGLVTYEPTEHFEPFRKEGCEFSFGIVTNSLRPYVRVKAGNDGQLWKIDATSQYAASATFRDVHRPIVARGLAAQLLYHAECERGIWTVNTDTIGKQYRASEEGKRRFTPTELQDHLREETERWRATQDEAKKWLPLELFSLIHEAVENYCQTTIIADNARDTRLLQMLDGDKSKYDMLIERGTSATKYRELGRVVVKIFEGKQTDRMAIVAAMMDSGKFAQLDGRPLRKNYKALFA